MKHRDIETSLDQIVVWDSPEAGLHYLCNLVDGEKRKQIPSLISKRAQKVEQQEHDTKQDLMLSGIMGIGGAGYEVASWFTQYDPEGVLTYGLAGIGSVIAAWSLHQYLSASRKRRGYEAMMNQGRLEDLMTQRAKRF